MKKQVSVSAYFFGIPGSLQDEKCKLIFEKYASKFIGSGTMCAGKAKGERDVKYDVPANKVVAVRRALRRAGFRLTPTLC